MCHVLSPLTSCILTTPDTLSLQAPRPEKKVTPQIDEQRNPQFPTSVPMPATIDEVTNEHVANLLADGAPAAAPVTDGSCDDDAV